MFESYPNLEHLNDQDNPTREDNVFMPQQVEVDIHN